MNHPRHIQKRRPRAFMALYLAIVIVLAGGATAYGVMSKTITVTIDGQEQTVRTFGDTVADVLDASEVSLRKNDIVEPGLDAVLANGDDVSVQYAKQLTVAVDGEVIQQKAHFATVGDALTGLGVAPSEEAFVSDDLDSALPRGEATIVVSNPKQLTVVADGKKSKLTTVAPTVAEVLDEAKVTLDADDEVKPGLDSYVKPEQKLKVVRIEKVTKTEKVDVDFDVKVRKDPEAFVGEVTVLTAGKVGRSREKVELTIADGKTRDRKVLASKVLVKPVTQVESHGTSTTPPDSVWDRLAQCESGGNWSINTGNGYYGGVQFSAATWRAMGGSGLPHQNSREEQIKRAKILQARSGWGQWPSCTKKLGLR